MGGGSDLTQLVYLGDVVLTRRLLAELYTSDHTQKCSLRVTLWGFFL